MTKKPSQGTVRLSRVGSMKRDDAYRKRVVDRVSNWVTVLSLIFIFAGFVEAKQMEITIGGLRLILITTIIGVVLAFFVCLALVIRFPFIKQASLILRLSLFFLASLGFSCLAMATASYLNRTFAEQQTFCKQVSIEHNASSEMGCYRNSRKIRLLYVVIDVEPSALKLRRISGSRFPKAQQSCWN